MGRLRTNYRLVGVRLTRNMKSAWVISSASVDKPWGEETCWNSQGAVIVKTITLKKGQRNSFKYNDVKSELLICASGKVKAYFAGEELIKNDIGDLTTAILKEKMALSVQSGCPYRLEAIEDSIILEVSSSARGQEVVNRIHDDYGRKTIKVSKHIEDIVKKWFLN